MNRQPPAGNSRKIHALSIEDNGDFARILGHLLAVLGCELQSATNARSGLLIVEQSPLDIIFCDIGLSGDMDGMDFARMIREDPSQAGLPMIAVSGRLSRSAREKALAAGFDRMLPKPVKFGDISLVLMHLRNGGWPGFPLQR